MYVSLNLMVYCLRKSLIESIEDCIVIAAKPSEF